MSAYEPAPELTTAALAAIMAPLPFYIRAAAKIIPASAKERTIKEALALAVPLSFGAIASAHSVGDTIAITREGKLTREAKEGLIKRIASWIVPNEVAEVANALERDVLRLASVQYAESSWLLTLQDGEAVLLVTGTSYVRESADTVADALFNSFEALKGYKDKIVGYLRPSS